MKTLNVEIGHLLMTGGLMGIMTAVGIMFDHVTPAESMRIMSGVVAALVLLIPVSRLN